MNKLEMVKVKRISSCPESMLLQEEVDILSQLPNRHLDSFLVSFWAVVSLTGDRSIQSLTNSMCCSSHLKIFWRQLLSRSLWSLVPRCSVQAGSGSAMLHLELLTAC